MAADIEFFLAPDDEAAAAVRPNGPARAYATVSCHSFDPDDAVVDWDMYFQAPSPELPPHTELYTWQRPSWVAPMLNDGIGVFAFPARLTRALAKASPSELQELAKRWTTRLREADGDDMTDDNPLEILREVARLASTSVIKGGALYCWHY